MSTVSTPAGADAVVRCVTIPVACPIGADAAGVPWTWATLDAALLPAFRLATDLANWCVRRLFVLDDPASPAAPEAVRRWYGYKDASENCPDVAKWGGAMASLNLVTRAVQRKYLRQRFDVMVRHDSSLLTFRFPQPFPVHNQNWHPEYEHGKHACVRLNLPGVGTVGLAIKTRADFRRQLAMFRQLHDGTAKKGEAALYRDRKGTLLLKMVGHFPKVERTGADNVAFVHTDPNALLVVEVGGRRANVTNGDHVRREIAKHKAFLRRAGQDKKREVRMDRRQRANLDAAVEARCGKQRARVDTAVKQVAAQVARMCQRQRVGLVCYDDGAKEFFPDGFPWHALAERLRQLLVGEMGCEWIDRCSPSFGGGFTRLTDEKEKDQWLTGVRKAKALAEAGRRKIAHARRPAGASHPAVSRPPATSCAPPATRSKTSSTTPSPTSRRRARSSTASTRCAAPPNSAGASAPTP